MSTGRAKLKGCPRALRLKSRMNSCRIEKGLIFISGGIITDKQEVSNDAFIYTPKRYTVKKLPDMLFPRCSHRSVMRYPWVYVTGGKLSSKDKDGTKDCERYNLVKRKW